MRLIEQERGEKLKDEGGKKRVIVSRNNEIEKGIQGEQRRTLKERGSQGPGETVHVQKKEGKCVRSTLDKGKGLLGKRDLRRSRGL